MNQVSELLCFGFIIIDIKRKKQVSDVFGSWAEADNILRQQSDTVRVNCIVVQLANGETFARYHEDMKREGFIF